MSIQQDITAIKWRRQFTKVIQKKGEQERWQHRTLSHSKNWLEMLLTTHYSTWHNCNSMKLSFLIMTTIWLEWTFISFINRAWWLTLSKAFDRSNTHMFTLLPELTKWSTIFLQSIVVCVGVSFTSSSSEITWTLLQIMFQNSSSRNYCLA